MQATRPSHFWGLIGFLPLFLGACSLTPSPARRLELTPETGRAPGPVAGPSSALAQVSAAGTLSIADVAERALPSVVNISLTKLARMPTPFPFPFSQPEDRRTEGMGSGVIVSADGYVLTNSHVVEGAQEIKVTTHDKRQFDAVVIGADPKSDLAVIKIKESPKGLHALEFGDSSRLRLGEVVLAIGNPFGIGQTVTMGIVSAKGRGLGDLPYEDFIQTDAAINPGNSGGALLNLEGKLVGINTAIISRTGGYQGIGFAIPSNMAAPIMESLKKSGKVVRGWLGVGIQEVDQELAQALKLPSASGVLVTDVKPGTPAAKAGLKRGDVVTRLDRMVMDSDRQFRGAIAAAGPGKRVTLEVLRDGKPLSVAVDLVEMPEQEGAIPGSGGGATKGGALDGLTLEAINPENRRAFQLPDEVRQGVIVTKVDPRSPAARAGLRPGDVLLEVNRVPVDNVQRFQDAYNKSKKSVLLLVNRRGVTTFVVVRGN